MLTCLSDEEKEHIQHPSSIEIKSDNIPKKNFKTIELDKTFEREKKGKGIENGENLLTASQSKKLEKKNDNEIITTAKVYIRINLILENEL
jgi:hypothetical protein